MDKAQLLEKIKNDDLTPKGRPGPRQVRVAIQQLQLLGTIKDLDAKVAYRARRELEGVVKTYHAAIRVARFRRKKHTRG